MSPAPMVLPLLPLLAFAPILAWFGRRFRLSLQSVSSETALGCRFGLR